MSIAVAPSSTATAGLRRTAVLVAVLIVAVALVAAVGPRVHRAPAADANPTPAPAFSVPSITGGPPISLQSFRGRPAVVNFFASWCDKCKTELPLLSGAARSDSARVQFVGIAVKDGRVPAAEMLARFGIRYEAGDDPAANLATAFGLTGLPGTAFISPDGRVVDLVQGPLSRAALDRRLHELTLQERG